MPQAPIAVSPEPSGHESGLHSTNRQEEEAAWDMIRPLAHAPAFAVPQPASNQSKLTRASVPGLARSQAFTSPGNDRPRPMASRGLGRPWGELNHSAVDVPPSREGADSWRRGGGSRSHWAHNDSLQLPSNTQSLLHSPGFTRIPKPRPIPECLGLQTQQAHKQVQNLDPAPTLLPAYLVVMESAPRSHTDQSQGQHLVGKQGND